MFENRRWLIISSSLTGSVDFNQVLESSPQALRLSLDGTQTFVKYEINEVTESYEEYYQDAEDLGTWYTSSVEAGVYGRPSIYKNGDREYTHSEILEVLQTEAWSAPFEEQL